jgi:hypothetical protein
MSSDAKVFSTAEAQSWGPYAPANPKTVQAILPRLLATTRALETAQTAMTIATSRANEEAARAEKAERARDQLAAVVVATGGLRYVDFAAGESVVVSDEIRGHELWSSMRETIRERDTARARGEKARKERDAARAALAKAKGGAL